MHVACISKVWHRSSRAAKAGVDLVIGPMELGGSGKGWKRISIWG